MRTKLNITFTLIVIIPVLVISFLMYRNNAEEYQRNAYESNGLMAVAVSRQIEMLVQDRVNLLKAASLFPQIISMDINQQRPIIQSFSKEQKDMESIIIVDITGQQTLRSLGTLANVADREYFKDIKNGESYVISEVLIAKGTGKASIILAVPIKKGEEITGILLGVLDLQEISELISNMRFKENGYVYLTDSLGQVLAHPDKKMVQEQQQLGDVEPVKRALAGEVGATQYNFEGREKIAGFSPVGLVGWATVVQIPKDEVMAALNKTRSMVIVIIFLSCLLAMIVGHFLSISFTRPLLGLIETAGALAEGNLAKRLIIESEDEIGQLGHEFNIMAGNLENMLGQLEIKNHSLKREINERQQAQVALIASEEKFAKAFQYASDVVGIVELDSPQRYVELSDAYFHVFGYSPRETIGHSSAEINLWDVPEQRVAAYEQLHRAGTFCNMEVIWRTKSGEARVGVCSAEVITISSKPHIVFVWHDITERKQAEIALRQANDELEEKVEIRTQELTATNQELGASNEELRNTLDLLQKMQHQLVESEKMVALGNLVAGIAHEISTPVGVGITATSHLKDVVQQVNELYDSGSLRRQDLLEFLTDLHEIAGMIYNNLDRAASLIRSFKQVSVDQSSEVKRIFLLENYLKHIIINLNSKIKQTKHQVTMECPDDLELDSFPSAFVQIVTNLVMNSLIHAYEPEDAGHIRIHVIQEAGNIVFTYSDDGKGMTSDVLRKIYEPFFTTKRGKGATGLGMHIVYNIVTQQLHGRVDCQSQLGRGTTFSISFPANVISTRNYM